MVSKEPSSCSVKNTYTKAPPFQRPSRSPESSSFPEVQLSCRAIPGLRQQQGQRRGELRPPLTMATQGVGRDSLGASTLTLGLANCPPLVSTSGVSALFAYATTLVYPLHQTVTTDSASYHCCPPTLRVLGAIRQVSAFLEGTANRNSETLLATPSSSRSACPSGARCFCTHPALPPTPSPQDTCPSAVHLCLSGYPSVSRQYLLPAFNISTHQIPCEILSPNKHL